jgi:hypothetical protein
MWPILEWVKTHIFGGKGTTQIGSGNQAVTGTTAGSSSPVVGAGRDVYLHINEPPRQEEDPLVNLEEPVLKLLVNLAESLAEHPLMRDIIVLHKKSIAYNWPDEHFMISADEEPGIYSFIKILLNHRLIIEIKTDFAYRLSEKLVSQLRKKITDAKKYQIHDTLLKEMRKGAIMCPWESMMPEVDRQTLGGVIALLRDEGLANISIGGHAVPSTGKAPSIDEIMQHGPAFNGYLTDKGVRAVDEYKENIVGQFLHNKVK